MKKILSIILTLTFLLSLASCASDDSGQNSQKKTTLMIYMIGSDLEAKSGAGTDDMNEIKASGIDVENNNVVIYTGGSPNWHSDLSKKDKNVIITLTEDGFKSEKSLTQTSMGKPETLTSFLDYCVKNKPAEHYDLILWDHGNGPLVGYGDSFIEDMLSHMTELKPFSDVEFKVFDRLFLDYCVLGGMPAVVRDFVEKKSFEGSLATQRQLMLGYEEDIRKYAEGLDQGKILSVFRSIPAQLAKDNKKFQFSKVSRSARAKDYAGCIEWLNDALYNILNENS